MIYLSQTGLKLVLTINPYISTNSENFDVGVKGQEISEGNSGVFNSHKKAQYPPLISALTSKKWLNQKTLLYYLIKRLYPFLI